MPPTSAELLRDPPVPYAGVLPVEHRDGLVRLGAAVVMQPGAPRDARQKVAVSLAGVDVRKLERLAAEQGRDPDELAQELLEKALGS